MGLKVECTVCSWSGGEGSEVVESDDSAERISDSS